MLAFISVDIDYMIMSENENVLFDPSSFEDARLEIPETLGKKRGEFLDMTRYVSVVPIETERIPFELRDTKTDFTSVDYAEGTTFEEDFQYWKPGVSPSKHYEGFLAGFPRILGPDRHAYDCLHIWQNNSDVLNSSYAIPLIAIHGLFVFSKFRTDLEADLCEIAFGDTSSRYEVPLLRHKTSGEIHYRDASADDIEEVIKSTPDYPIKVYGGWDVEWPEGISGVGIETNEALKTLLEN